MEKNVYRTLAIGASATLDDLHLAIQDAYHFDNGQVLCMKDLICVKDILIFY